MPDTAAPTGQHPHERSEAAPWPATVPPELRAPLQQAGELGALFLAFHRALGVPPTAAEDTGELAQQIKAAVHEISDSQLAQLAAQLGPNGTIEHLTQAAMADATARMQHVLAALDLCEPAR